MPNWFTGHMIFHLSNLAFHSLVIIQQISMNYPTSGSNNTTADVPVQGRLCALDNVTGSAPIFVAIHSSHKLPNRLLSLPVASLHPLLDLFSSAYLKYKVYSLLTLEVIGRSENVNVTFDTFSGVSQLYNGMTISGVRIAAEALQVLVNNALTYVAQAHFPRPAIQSHENMSVDSTATYYMETTSNGALSSNTMDTTYLMELGSINWGGNAVQGMCGCGDIVITGIDAFAFVRT
jgi:hypothetical protein